MNWKEFSKERPKAEPHRQIRVRTEDGLEEFWWTGGTGAYCQPTHWAEIEQPVREERVKAITQALREILRDENLTEAGFRERLESAGVDVDKFLDRFAPKPDPFEEAWSKLNNSDAFTHDCDEILSKLAARQIWDAAMKHKEEGK